MKQLNDTQKKWLLTASLASLLSFNLIMSLAGPATIHSADFASTTAKVGKIYTLNGRPVELRFTQLNDEQVKVRMRPLKGRDKTESSVSAIGACPECQIGIMRGSIESTVEELVNGFSETNAQMLADLESSSDSKASATVANADDASGSSDNTDVIDEKTAKNMKAIADEAAKRTSRSGSTSGERLAANEALVKLENKCADRIKEVQAECAGKGLIKLLDSNTDISGKQALDSWQRNVRRGLVSALGNSDNPTAQQFAKDLLSEMLQKLDPQSYELVRKNLVLTASEAVKLAYINARDLAANGNLAKANDDMRKAQALRVELNRVLNASIDREDMNDTSMVHLGYELPTKRINELYAAGQPYASLPLINMDLYNGTNTTATQAAGSVTGAAPSTGTTAGTGTVALRPRVVAAPNHVTTLTIAQTGQLPATSNQQPSVEFRPVSPAQMTAGPGILGHQMLQPQQQQGLGAPGLPPRH